MKVESKKGSTPITITIETYEEACELWHRLDLAQKIIEHTHNANYEYVKASRYYMWAKFNDVFTPKQT